MEGIRLVTKPAELLLYLYAESPVHAGASDSLDVIDLPVQREATTTYPVIWGQSLKGALRQAAEDAGWLAAMTTRVFGREVTDQGTGESEAGLLAVGDAQLVAMPVPTLRQTFAWVTSGIALNRLARKYAVLGRDTSAVPDVASDKGAAAGTGWTTTDTQVLGPCVLPLGEDENLRKWADLIAVDAIGTGPGLADFAAKLKRDLLLVGSDAMPMLLTECTELTARVQLTKGKTVEHGPFYSEYLPAETILASALTLRPGARQAEQLNALRELLSGGPLQIGGDETLGKGLVWTRLIESAQ
jgi:CRISPR-associated protein Cmr4